MRLIIRPNADEAASYIAEYIIQRIHAFAPTAERPFVLGLPTGSSPLPIYRALVAAHRDGRLSFRHVVTFNMDEYVGLPRDHPQSYRAFMWRHLFGHVDVDPAHVHLLDGNAADLTAECRGYEQRIRAAGGVELFLGGVGSDGHVAFNEPGSSLASRTRVKSLAHDTLRANARFFGGDMAAVPRMALTVGVQTIMEAREVVIVATGAAKARAVQQAVEGGVGHLCTLSCLQLHPRSMVVVDDDATQELKVKTVNYFKGVEHTILQQGGQDEVLLSPSRPAIQITTSAVRRSPDASEEDDGDLTPDSMSSRIIRDGYPKPLSVRSATMPFGFA